MVASSTVGYSLPSSHPHPDQQHSEFLMKRLGARSMGQAVVATSNILNAEIVNGSAPVRQTANQPTLPSGRLFAVSVNTPGGKKQTDVPTLSRITYCCQSPTNNPLFDGGHAAPLRRRDGLHRTRC